MSDRRPENPSDDTVERVAEAIWRADTGATYSWVKATQVGAWRAMARAALTVAASEATPADLIAVVRRGVESGTIKGEVVRWCVKHNSAMFTNHGETCHMAQIAAYRLGRNPFDRIACDVVERLFIGPVSDGGSET